LLNETGPLYQELFESMGANSMCVPIEKRDECFDQETLRELIERGHALDQVLTSMTSNVARLLKLENKGRIITGADADFVCLGEALDVRHVMARGQWMVRDQVPVVLGLFEE